MKKDKTTPDAFQWAYDKFIANDPQEVALYQKEQRRADVAQKVYDLRDQAGISRKKLADLAGVDEAVIEDIEEANYEGDFLSMASRINNALQGNNEEGKRKTGRALF
ncbi:transcriptional regulator [Candidatus Micrarchaeota archaeon]|nr:transcriptional regulator [Candidatus Micrarchaeota archaeon]